MNFFPERYALDELKSCQTEAKIKEYVNIVYMPEKPKIATILPSKNAPLQWMKGFKLKELGEKTNGCLVYLTKKILDCGGDLIFL